MIGWIIAGLIFPVVAVLLFVLLTPLRITIDTLAKDFNVRMNGIFKAELLADEEKFFTVRFRLFWKEINVEPMQEKAQRRGMNFIKKAHKHTDIYKKLPRLMRLLHAFRIRKLFVDIDGQNVMVNAWLHPVFYALTAEEKFFHVNYFGRESLVFEAQTRIILLLYRFFK